MINIAIVEDNKNTLDKLKDVILSYQEEFDETFNIMTYDNGLFFLEERKMAFDIVFMDIDMPLMDGISASKKLRENDQNAIIIFITNLAQYAIKGYEVNALDFILKPVKPTQIKTVLEKAIKNLHSKNEKHRIIITLKTGTEVLYTDDIYYIETMSHRLYYHTSKGTLDTYGSLSEEEKNLSSFGFARCNSCYLVNLKHVKSVKRYKVNVGPYELDISRPKYMAFKETFLNWLEKNIR